MGLILENARCLRTRWRAVQLKQAVAGDLATDPDLVKAGALRSGELILDPEMPHDHDDRGLQFMNAVLESRDPPIVGHGLLLAHHALRSEFRTRRIVWGRATACRFRSVICRPFASLTLAPSAQLNYRSAGIKTA